VDARRLIVEVLWGPQGGRKVAVAPGEKIRVGRNERADFAIPDDQLSAVHFELAWDGAAGKLRDLGTPRGVKVGGAPVSEASLGHGTWIRAGATDFQVWIEGGLRAPRDDGGNLPVAEALAALAEAGRLYAVLDASRDERIPELLHASMEGYKSLYDGPEGEGMADIAPHLVRFSRKSPLLDRVVREGWGRRWGIFLLSDQPFKEVRRHLRRFLMVEDDESGERMYFRFYDPEVLRIFLPTVSTRQAEELWGDIEAFVFEGEDGSMIRRDRREAT
jgi:hypothetical protein